MKFPTLVFAVFPFFAAKVHGHTGTRMLRSDAFNHGRELAYELWSKNTYECNLKGVMKDFWDDVKKELYDECEDQYFYSSKVEQECKKGLKDWTEGKVRKCANTDDCRDIGVTVGSGIASTYCPVLEHGHAYALQGGTTLPIFLQGGGQI